MATQTIKIKKRVRKTGGDSDTEFFQLANGMEYDRVWKIIAELMETLQVINPRLYAGVIKKL